jgi:RNA polymerase sigma-70 factor (ECF subfamily)
MIEFGKEAAIEDQQVVQDVLSGDKDAFAALVRKYHPRVIGLCLSLLRNPAEADDAAQDIFVKAYSHLSRFRADSSFSTWLYSIAHFHCLDILKTRTRRRTDSLDALLEARGDGAFTPQPVPDGAREEAAREALAQLKPDEQLILTLREVQGLTYEELAQVLRVSLDAVKARLKRARQALKNKSRHIWAPEGVTIGERPQS